MQIHFSVTTYHFANYLVSSCEKEKEGSQDGRDGRRLCLLNPLSCCFLSPSPFQVPKPRTSPNQLLVLLSTGAESEGSPPEDTFWKYVLHAMILPWTEKEGFITHPTSSTLYRTLILFSVEIMNMHRCMLCL